MKKIASLLLCAGMLLLCLFGCAKLDTTGLLDAAPALLAEAAELNRIYYGEGIPYLSGGTPLGNYYPADPDYLDEHGFHTVTELQEKTKTVFSKGYCAAIFGAAFSGFSAEGSGYVYARYSSNQAENLRDEEETILVSAVAENKLAHILSVNYDTARAEIGEVGTDYAILLVPVTTTFAPDGVDYTEPYTAAETMEVNFVYESGWRIDSATY